MKPFLFAAAVFLTPISVYCATSYGLDRREVGEPFLGGRLPSSAADFANNDTKLPQLLSQTGAFEPFQATGDLVPVRAMIPYTVNTPLWSDAAAKLRWIYVPKDAKIDIANADSWKFPPGTVIVKHFDLVINENTGEKRRLETRFLVVDNTGKNTSYYITYRWKPDQTDAVLLPRAGDKETIQITTATGTRPQVWSYPSRTGCAVCHNNGVGVGGTLGVLGVKTAQLNGSLLYQPSGVVDNQLRTLNHVGLFDNAPNGLDTAVMLNGTLTIAGQPQMAQFGGGVNNLAFTMESRVRSYLSVNCAHCHGYRPRAFDARFTTPFDNQGIKERIAFGKTAPAPAADEGIYGRDARNMPSTSLTQLRDPQWLTLLTNYLTQSFNLVLGQAPALNKVTLIFDSVPDNTGATPGNYKLALASNPNSTIALLPNPTVNGNSLTFDLASAMTKNVMYKVTLTGDVFDTASPKNKAWKDKFVEFRAPNPGPEPDDGSPPANDNFAAALLLTGTGITLTNFNCYGTKEPGEPDHAANAGGSSVWFAWTAPNSNPVQVDTLGSDFDTLLAVYTGNSVSALSLVVSNNDADDLDLELVPSADPRNSSAKFNAVQGQTYYIAVDGYNDGYFGQCGTIQLHLHAGPPPQAPPNDAFANQMALSGSSGSITWSNSFATKEDGEPDHAGDPGGASVWFQWTAPADGQVSFDTHGSALDTLLAVYLGTSVTNLTLVAENDDDSALLTSGVQFSAASNTTYAIAIDGYNGETGGFVLNYSFTQAPVALLPGLQTVPSFLILPSDDSAFHLQISGPAGAEVQVEVSEDLVHWVGVASRVLAGSPWIFSDPFAPEISHRFYRVVRHLN